MAEKEGKSVIQSAISTTEWRTVPEAIAQKLERTIGQKLEELVTSRALLESKNSKTEELISTLQEKNDTMTKEHDRLTQKAESSDETIKELENQLSAAVADVTKLQNTCNKLELDAAEFRNKRNLAEDERDELMRMIERRDAEVERIRSDMSALTKQLEDAIAAKCEALVKMNEVDSLKFSVEFKEKHLEQERTLFTSQIQKLTEDLEQRTEELLNMRRDNTSRCVQLENKLSEKTQESASINSTILLMQADKEKLIGQMEEMAEKLSEEKNIYNKSLEAFQAEMNAQTRLTEVYKGVVDEKTQHANDLENAVYELKAKLDDALEKYGDLETKHKETELSTAELFIKKNECIELLKKELETANDLITNGQNDKYQRDVDELSPAASNASKLIKTGMTMTEVYTQYVQASDLLAHEKVENGRLQNYIQSIIQELEEKGPLIAKQREHYERSLENISQMTKQMDSYMSEIQQLREANVDFKKNDVVATRENNRLKSEISDLSRQVCHLIREVEQSRAGSGGTSMDADLSDSTCSADIISKRLVTFSDINELQSNNQRLVALVRELSTKQEEAELMDPSMIANLKKQIDSMRENQAELLEQQDNQNSMVKMLVEQRDTYKNLYYQHRKGNHDHDLEKSPSNKTQDDSDMQIHPEEKCQELEQTLQKTKNELALFQEELETYKKEKGINEKMLIEQTEKMRGEIQELMRQNSKLSAKCETGDQMLKVLKNNMDTYKRQIDLLEERNKIYSESIVKHETSTTYIKDQMLEAQTKLSKSEVMLGNLQKENSLLRDAESRLVFERDSLKRESQSLVLMLTNIELIKATLERNDAESKIKLEENVREAHRECSALRRRLQEEQDRFRQLGEYLKKQTETAQARMQEEKDVADKLRADLNQARDYLSEKSNQLSDLSKKLKDTLAADFEGSVEAKKHREMERMLNDAQIEIEGLKQQLRVAKEAVVNHCNVAQAAERQLIDMNEQQIAFKTEMDKSIAEKLEKIVKLEETCSELQGELSINNDGRVSVTSNLSVKLGKLEIRFNVVSAELDETKLQLDAAKGEIRTLSDNLELAENKYSREMALHSADLEAMKAIKESVNNLLHEVNEVKHERDRALEALVENKASWEVREELFGKEKGTLESRFIDLNKQNTLLLDQLQELNTQLTVMQTQIIDPHNHSVGDSSFNRSINEDEVKSSDQLVKIIKYLRTEKDIAISKCDILDAEHTRMKSQQELIFKQLEEAKAALESERQKSEVSIVTAAKHSEVLRKIETLNAITDSNRSLRIERDTLLTDNNEIKARTTYLEDQMVPLQEKICELTKKSEAIQTENITLRGEATRWRQRANMLIEKSNRTSPEDWKKLQGERESLAKQLTIERSNNTKLNDDINNLTRARNMLEEQVRSLKIQQDQQRDEMDKLSEELGSLRTQVANISQDLDQSRNSFIRLTEDHRVITETLASKDISINDLKNNLAQIRKIAKKYKIQAEEQVREIDLLKQQADNKAAEDFASEEKKEELLRQGRVEAEERITQLEQKHTDRMSELNVQVNSTTEEIDKNKKEIEGLKENLQTCLEKEERVKVLFKNAKDRILSLTEQNNTLRAKLLSSRDDASKSDASTSNADLEKCHKEKEEILNLQQLEKERHVQEIETLTQRVTQLQRQLGLQQGSKPSTSSEKEKSTTEPPTANIKPMAGHSTNTQTQSVPIQPWRSAGEPPLASIRPMSMQLRTVAVLPTSQSPSTVMVPPQQQVHTTGSSSNSIEAMSSSPTSSHTDYVPPTSSASSAILGPRQVAVPPTQSNQDNEDDDSTMQVQQTPQQQAVALVLPRVEPPPAAQEQGTSNSSNTVTTSQVGHKRPREVDTECQHDEPNSKGLQQPKRTRIVQGTSTSSGGESTVSVSESGLEVEYQVPTSSQRDHEEDAVIVVESDEEGPDEGDGEDYAMPYEDPDTQDPDQDDEGGNEVEVIEDSSEVPNQSERGGESDMLQGDGEMDDEECEDAEEGEEEEVMQPEATSSGTNVSTSVAVTLPSFSRTRQVAPLSRQQQSHLLLPHGLEEGGDDGIVPSTPTLFVSRRSDGFGEAVSSPHVPTSGRFTFTESGAPSTAGSNDVPEQTLENMDDNSTGRSVPNTPLQTSPQESGPGSEEQAPHEGDGELPIISISCAAEEAVSAEGECMGPPGSVAGTSTDTSQPADLCEDIQEGEDGVSSEGEKAASTEDGGGEEEGREAEASPSTNLRSRNMPSLRFDNASGQRRASRSFVRGVSRSGPTPIVWGADQQQQHQQQRPQMQQRQDTPVHRGGGRGPMSPIGSYPRTARRSRGRNSRGPYGGRF